MKIQFTGSKDFGQYLKLLVAGNPGAGKTLFSSTFPHPFYASVEGGLLSLKTMGLDLPVSEVTSTHDLDELLGMLRQDPAVREKLVGAPVETIVLDTIDELQGILIQERLKSEKKTQMAIGDYGWLGEQMKGLVAAFRNLDMHVVFTSHLKEVSDAESGRVWYKPALSGQAADKLPGYVDLALALTAGPVTEVVDGETRRVIRRALRTFPDRQYEWVKDRSGRLPQEVPINFHDDFQRIFDHVYGGTATEVETPRIVDLSLEMARNTIDEIVDIGAEPSADIIDAWQPPVAPQKRVIKRQAS